jgi:hypothetical protein
VIRSWRGIVSVVAVASVGAPPTAGAQLRATIDLGGASVRYADTVRVTASTFSPVVRLDGERGSAAVAGTLSLPTTGGWSSQGGVAMSALSRPRGPVRLELAADGGGSWHEDGTRTGRYLASARLHGGLHARGFWLGGGAGQTWDGTTWHTMADGEVGAWARLNDATVLGTVTPVVVGDSVRYADAQALMRWEGHRADVTMSAGIRAGDALVVSSARGWGSVSATVWIAAPIGIVAEGGSYPVDFTQGFPGGKYLSLALRFAPRRFVHRGSPPARPGVGRASLSADGEPRVEVVTATGEHRTVRVRATGARSVEVMGDLTAWKPVALAPAAEGWWAVVLPLTSGVYQLNVRVDGTRWDVPAGATATVDEFGVRVGSIIVR